MTPPFVHLRLRTEYSLVDSTIRVPPLVKRCAALGMPAVAVTDAGNLFALVKFYRAAEDAGLKPIVGADLWLEPEGEREAATRITLLCRDRDGYGNLSRLVSRAYLERGRQEKVQVKRDWVKQAATGLFLLLGQDSDVGRLLALGHRGQARRTLEAWLDHFDQRAYLALSRLGHDDEAAFIAGATDLAASLGCPALACNEVRFLEQGDFDAHEARVCIAQGRTLGDPRRPREYTDQQYLKSPAEMAALFADLPGAIENAVELARRCNLELEFGKYYLPAFPLPAGESEASCIRRRSHEGLAQRLASHPLAPGSRRADYEQRLERELEVIVGMGFPGYFLIVADFIQWAKDNGIPVGPGRGSGAGSLVAWALGITDLDPLRFELLFERFLNPERVSMPDFDIDFCMDRRDEVIDYVARRYGRDKVCQIITYGSMAAKAVVRDVGRVLGMPYGQVDGIAKLIPNTLGITLEDALGRSEKAQKQSDLVSPDLVSRYRDDEEVRLLVDLALRLEGLTRNAGKHAGGVVIAPSTLTDFTPLYCEPGGEGVVTQFDKDDVETIGLVKFDFLGLRTLTIIDWAVKAINLRRAAAGEPPLDVATLPLDDPEPYRLMRAGRTTAVFQLESVGMKRLMVELAPDCFDDVVALVALFRPGPLQSGMAKDFIDRKHGRVQVSYPHPSLEAILKPTYGTIVYQEQVMQIAQELAGYTLGGADLLRRAMGKKKASEMAKQRAIFEQGAEAQGIDPALASSIFDLMEKFAEYGFNKSHSAAYALLSYQTAWLKVHYPAEFMAAVLSADMDNTDKVVALIDEVRAMELELRPPDVNASDSMFRALADGSIRYGLGAIKGVGRGLCEAIVEARETGGPFRDLLDFCTRVDALKLNKRALEALVLAGALDPLGRHRAELRAHIEPVAQAAARWLDDRASGQGGLFGEPTAPPRLDLPECPPADPLELLRGEREVLGHYLSGHPTRGLKDALSQLTTCAIGEVERHHRPGQPERRGANPGNLVVLGGQVISLRRRPDAPMSYFQLEDWSGRIEVSLYQERFSDCSHLLVRDAFVLVEGELRADEFSGGYTLRGSRVWSLDEAYARFARALKVQLNGVDPGFAERLARTLKPWQGGETPLLLHYRGPTFQAEVELDPTWRLRAAPALLEALRALPGVRAARVELSRPVG
jgi:DNA polymerase-3 subunit alpha